MKTNFKKIIISTLCLGGVFTLAGCNLTNLFNNKERTVNDIVDDASDTVTFSSEGFFRSERVYNANGNNQSYVLTFDKQGGLEIKDLSDNSVIEYTYKAIDNLIEVKTKGEDPQTSYIDFCENVLFVPTHSHFGTALFVFGFAAHIQKKKRAQNCLSSHASLSFSFFLTEFANT